MTYHPSLNPFPTLENAAVNLSTSTASAKTSALARGLWTLTVDDDTHVVAGPSGSVAATVTDTLVKATDPPRVFVVNDDDTAIAGILSAGSSTLRLTRGG